MFNFEHIIEKLETIGIKSTQEGGTVDMDNTDLMTFWNFISEFDKAYEIHRKKVMQRYDMSAIEVDVLLFIANNPSLNTASDIVRFRKIAKSHVSLAVKSLLGKGYLEKYADGHNRKLIRLSPSASAKEMIAFGQAEQRAFGAALEQGISAEEHEHFRQYMSLLTRNLRDMYD